MVLQPISATITPDAAAEAQSAWRVVERTQRADAREWWLVPQPAHSALAGEIAAKLRPEFFGLGEDAVDAIVVRAIALHDAGWGQNDAQQIQALRGGAKSAQPTSFLALPAREYIAAWSASADVAEKFSPLAGYIVSRHFWRLASREHQDGDAPLLLEQFRKIEERRQAKLLPASGRDAEELEKLTDLLQCADLISLYLCCGSELPVEIETRGGKVRVQRTAEALKSAPFLFRSGCELRFSAMRFPGSARDAKTFVVRCGADDLSG